MTKPMRVKNTETRRAIRPGEVVLGGTNTFAFMASVNENGRAGILIISDNPNEASIPGMSAVTVLALFQAQDGQLVPLDSTELYRLKAEQPRLWAMWQELVAESMTDPKLRPQ